MSEVYSLLSSKYFISWNLGGGGLQTVLRICKRQQTYQYRAHSIIVNDSCPLPHLHFERRVEHAILTNAFPSISTLKLAYKCDILNVCEHINRGTQGNEKLSVYHLLCIQTN